MKDGDYLAVWLSDGAAKALLGLPKSTGVSRWCVLGQVKQLESSVGIWLDVDVVQERKGSDKKVVRTWKVNPPVCLIRWDFIIHAQLWGETMPDKREIGFKQVNDFSSN